MSNKCTAEYYDNDVRKLYWYRCSACDSKLILGVYNYCPKCGRKIKWGKENENIMQKGSYSAMRKAEELPKKIFMRTNDPTSSAAYVMPERRDETDEEYINAEEVNELLTKIKNNIFDPNTITIIIERFEKEFLNAK